MTFTRLHALVIPLLLVGLLVFCFAKIQQTTDGAVHVLMDMLLAEPGGEQSDPLPMTYQQLRRVMASTTYYRLGFYSGAFLLLVYMMIMATQSVPKAERPAFKAERPVFKAERPATRQVQPTPRPAPSAPRQAQPPPKQRPQEPQQKPPTPQRPIPGTVRLADDVSVEDEQPMLTAELPRPTDIVTRSKRNERSG